MPAFSPSSPSTAFSTRSAMRSSAATRNGTGKHEAFDRRHPHARAVAWCPGHMHVDPGRRAVVQPNSAGRSLRRGRGHLCREPGGGAPCLRPGGAFVQHGPERPEYRRQWINPPSPGSKPQPKPAAKPDVASAGPKSAAQRDQEIDAGIARHWWPPVALTLNAFNLDDITKRVGSDQRLTAHRRELMKGALDTMVLWPPPNRVADAIHAADADAARLGRVDFIDYCLAGVGSWWDRPPSPSMASPTKTTSATTSRVTSTSSAPYGGPPSRRA